MALNKKPLISTIIPIYNVESYLSQTIDSIIKQTIGFEDNIELILINDGSPDNSEQICLKYKDKYPNNITYVHQKNCGVSATRNYGAQIAKGEYIHFMDSDDVISNNYYQESIKLLKQNDDIDFVAAKILYFDGIYNAHYLNGKFKNTRIINVESEPDKSILHLPTTILRREAIANILFDTKLVITEDAKFLSEVLVKKKKYGVVSRPTYFYRKRQSSAIGGKLKNKKYYLETPTRALGAILDTWTQNGQVDQYAQHLVMNDLAWKFMEEKDQNILTNKEVDEYKSTLYSLVSKIDDRIIINNKILTLNHKIFLLKKKHGEHYEDRLSFNKNRYFFNGISFFNPSVERDDVAVVFDFIHSLGGGKYKIEGFAQKGLVSGTDSRYIKTSQGNFPLKMIKRKQRKDIFLGDVVTEGDAFEVTIKVQKIDTIEAVLRTFTDHELLIPIFTKNFT